MQNLGKLWAHFPGLRMSRAPKNVPKAHRGYEWQRWTRAQAVWPQGSWVKAIWICPRMLFFGLLPRWLQQVYALVYPGDSVSAQGRACEEHWSILISGNNYIPFLELGGGVRDQEVSECSTHRTTSVTHINCPWFTLSSCFVSLFLFWSHIQHVTWAQALLVGPYEVLGIPIRVGCMQGKHGNSHTISSVSTALLFILASGICPKALDSFGQPPSFGKALCFILKCPFFLYLASSFESCLKPLGYK